MDTPQIRVVDPSLVTQHRELVDVVADFVQFIVAFVQPLDMLNLFVKSSVSAKIRGGKLRRLRLSVDAFFLVVADTKGNAAVSFRHLKSFLFAV
ncbi:MAG: hypothetical protein RR622_05905 [Hydrogenoanaerobacterium sp.]